MNPRLRRLLYLLAFLVWLLIMLFPTFAFVLATQEQIQLGSPPGRQWRIFLITETEAQGVGIERTRPVQEPAGCAQTNVSFLLWEGEEEAVTYCTCYNERGAVLSSEPGACQS